MRSAIATALIISLTACSASSVTVPITTQQGAGSYHVVQTPNAVLAADAAGKTVASVTMLADNSGSVTQLPDGATETIRFADLSKGGTLALGDGRAIRISGGTATYLDASGRALAFATRVAGGIEVNANGTSRFEALPSARKPMYVSLACELDYTDYGLAVAAELAGLASLDPVAVVLAAAAAELAVGRIEEDC